MGADWGTVDNATGIFTADTRYNLVTHDGANIYIKTSGPAQRDGRVHLRLEFETGHASYYWMNNIVAVGILSSTNNNGGESGGWISTDAWQLESPPK